MSTIEKDPSGATFPPPPPAYGQPQYGGMSQYSNPQDSQYGKPHQYGGMQYNGYPPPTVSQPHPVGGHTIVPVVRPRNWLVPAILSMFCFWPTGLMALIHAVKAKNESECGHYAEAEKRNVAAKRFVIISVVIGTIIIILMVVWRIVAQIVIFKDD